MGDYICPLGDCIDVLRAYFDPTGDYIDPVGDFNDLPAKYRRSSGATRPLAISCVPVRWLLRTSIRSPQVAPELVEAAPEPNQAAPELYTDPMGDYTDPMGAPRAPSAALAPRGINISSPPRDPGELGRGVHSDTVFAAALLSVHLNLLGNSVPTLFVKAEYCSPAARACEARQQESWA